MLLDDEQRAAVQVKESAIVQAGPGSGKTRTLVAKALREVALLRNTSFRVACITMSNAATSVMMDRVSALATEEDQERLLIGTIHAFCLQEIFAPFHRSISEYKNGWQVLAPDQTAYWAYAAEAFGRDENYEKQLPFVRRNVTGDPVNTGKLDASVICDFWENIERAGLIDFPSLLYRSYQVLQSHPNARAFLAARYAWILVDEFQDTSDMQLSILLELNCGNTRYFLVGDENQAIYSFAGAEREAQREFLANIDAGDPIRLTLNHRSTTPICDVANAVIDTGMTSAFSLDGLIPTVRYGRARQYDELAQTLENEFFAQTDALGIPRNRTAVIAPDTFVVQDVIDALRRRGVTCALPDAMLEREPLLRLLRGLGEQLAGYEQAGHRFTVSALKDVLAYGQPIGWIVSDWLTEILSYDLLESFRLTTAGDASWNDVVRDTAGHLIERARELNVASIHWDEPMQQADRILERHQLNDFNPCQFRLFSEEAVVTHIFRSKGLEFIATALVEFDEGRVPHYRNGDTPEERRKMYVAVTRASELLRLYCDRNNRSEYVTALLHAEVVQSA